MFAMFRIQCYQHYPYYLDILPHCLSIFIRVLRNIVNVMLACTAAFFVFVLVYTTSIQALLDPYASSSQLDRMEEKLENFQTKFDLCEKQIGKTV